MPEMRSCVVNNTCMSHKWRLRKYLEEVYQHYHRPEYLGSDPLVIVRRFESNADREIAALFSALLAYGNVKQINRDLVSLFRSMDWTPAAFLRDFRFAEASRRLDGFKHRFTDRTDVLCLCWLLHQLLRHSNLETAFVQGWREGETDLVAAASRFCDTLYSMDFGPYLDRSQMLSRTSFKHFLPRADRGSACKRIHLFLRWVVRQNDGIDLGIWKTIAPSRLLIPVDTHILRIAQQLGICSRRSASAAAAREITDHLRHFCPEDPVRYDFSLCRTGILGQSTCIGMNPERRVSGHEQPSPSRKRKRVC